MWVLLRQYTSADLSTSSKTFENTLSGANSGPVWLTVGKQAGRAGHRHTADSEPVKSNAAAAVGAKLNG